MPRRHFITFFHILPLRYAAAAPRFSLCCCRQPLMIHAAKRCCCYAMREKARAVCAPRQGREALYAALRRLSAAG